jgi:hypothetical protein
MVEAKGFEPSTSWSRTTRNESKLSNWLELPCASPLIQCATICATPQRDTAERDPTNTSRKPAGNVAYYEHLAERETLQGPHRSTTSDPVIRDRTVRMSPYVSRYKTKPLAPQARTVGNSKPSSTISRLFNKQRRSGTHSRVRGRAAMLRVFCSGKSCCYGRTIRILPPHVPLTTEPLAYVAVKGSLDKRMIATVPGAPSDFG